MKKRIRPKDKKVQKKILILLKRISRELLWEVEWKFPHPDQANQLDAEQVFHPKVLLKYLTVRIILGLLSKK